MHIPFAILADRVLHLDEIADGQDGLKCPGCGGRVLAIPQSRPHRDGSRSAGTITSRHLRHAVDTACSGGPETALHAIGKRIVAEEMAIALPTHVVRYKEMSSKHRDDWSYERAEMEPWRNGLRPDVVLHRCDGNELAVEIRVRHEVDEDKREELVRRRASCIEVDLRSLLTPGITFHDIRQAVIAGADRIWISHEEQDARRDALAVKWSGELPEAARHLLDDLTAPKMVPDDEDDLEDLIDIHGLDPFIGIPVAGDHWFAESSRYWQSRRLLGLRHYAEHSDPQHVQPHDARLQHHTHRYRDLPEYDDDLMHAAGHDRRSYSSVEEALRSHGDEVGKRRDPDRRWPHAPQIPCEEGILINPDWARYARILARLHDTHVAILLAIDLETPHDDIRNAHRTWLRRPVVSRGRTPLDLCRTGGPDAHRLLAHVEHVNSTVRGEAPPTRYGMGLVDNDLLRIRGAQWTPAKIEQGSPWEHANRHKARALRMLRDGLSPLRALQQLAQLRGTAREAGSLILERTEELGGTSPAKFATDTATLLYVVPTLDRIRTYNTKRYRRRVT